MTFNNNKMSEAEVSLRIAIYLIENLKINGDVLVAIDGAQIKTGKDVHFEINEFINHIGIKKIHEGDKWQGEYKLAKFENKIVIHSRPGEGDVNAQLASGKQLVIESKKGDLVRRPGGKEYPLLREAIGQLVTVESIMDNSLIFVAVPKSEKNIELINRWKNVPLIKKLNLGFIMIDRDQRLESTIKI